MSKKIKILLISLIVIVVSILGYGVWYFFLRPAPPVPLPPPPTVERPPAAKLPPAAPPTLPPTIIAPPLAKPPAEVIPAPEITPRGEIITQRALGGLTRLETLVTDKDVKIETIGNTGNAMAFFDTNSNTFFKVSPDGQIEPLSNKAFFQVEKATWSPNASQAILEYPDGSNIFYDFNTEEQITLPDQWEEFDFSPQGNKIAFKNMGIDYESRWIAIADTNGSRARLIEHLGNEGDRVQIDWSPNNQIVATVTESKNFDQQDVFFVGFNGENFRKTVIQGRGLQSKWSNQGDRLLYSVFNFDNGYRPELWLVDAVGETIGANRQRLNLQTWADKCAIGQRFAYCAVPRTMPEGAGIVPEVTDNIADDLFKIDISTGSVSRAAEIVGSYNIKSLIITGDEQTLIFSATDHNGDQAIHKIDL